MRAAILREYGATPELGELDDPTPGEDQVVGDVLAAGLNPVDLRIASGQFWTGAPPLPSIASSEGVARLPDGRRVYFDSPVKPYGSLGEQVLLPAEHGFDVPEGVDDGLAVSLGIAGLAGWLALEWSANLQPGETVIVLGASGTVGLIAVQAAKLLGASRVVAAARREDGLHRAEDLGADAIVSLADTPPDELADALREAAGGGADVVV